MVAMKIFFGIFYQFSTEPINHIPSFNLKHIPSIQIPCIHIQWTKIKIYNIFYCILNNVIIANTTDTEMVNNIYTMHKYYIKTVYKTVCYN